MVLIDQSQTFDRADLGEVVSRIHAGKSAGRTVLLATVRASLAAGRIKCRAVAAEIALHREQVFSSVDRSRQRFRFEPKIIAESFFQPAARLCGLRFARNQGNRVVWTLRRAVSAAYAAL